MSRLWLLLFAVGLCRGGVMDMESEEIDSSEWGVKGIRAPKATNCSCGWANKAGKRIVNGRETGVNEYPLMAGIMYRSSKFIFCGGAVITEWHVLTAAHCTVPANQEKRQLSIVVGEHHRYQATETDATRIYNVERTIDHEGYRPLMHPNDISLLVLEEKISFNNKVGPACLPNQLMDLSGKYIRVIGWGRTSAEGSGSDVLLKVDLRVVPKPECNSKLPFKLPADIPRQFCTYRKNKDSCKGDSGGPLIWLDPQTNRFTLVGLVSFGIGCAGKTPGVNTNVGYYLDWIHEQIARSHPADTCAKM